ncbi:MAG: lysophospholipase [Zoogloeaceae bacterium]|jgi:non-heme chloroperoxidase|nr:lysophospholipase [Zoogloeaceae bacterium]
MSEVSLRHERVEGREVFFFPASSESEVSAPPLLFIHGAFAGAWFWERGLTPWFAQAGYSVYALSLRGHGGSDAGGGAIEALSIADYVEDVEIVADWVSAREKVSAPALIGHSMGGFVAQKYLERRSAPAVALLCSVPPQGLLLSFFNLLSYRPYLLQELNNVLRDDLVSIPAVREALFAQPVEEELLEYFRARMQLESQRAIWDMSFFNLPLLTAERRPPMWVAGAEKDVLIPAFLVEATARSYSLPPRIFAGMGHALTHERGWPLVARELDAWLTEIFPRKKTVGA